MADEKGKNPSTRRTRHDGQILLASSKVKATAHSKLLEDSVLPIMAPDDITAVVKTDPTILSVGSQMAENRGKEKAVEVSQEMRLLARVVLEM